MGQKFNYEKRLKQLRKKMNENGVDAVVFGGADRLDANAYYYSGDTAFPSVAIITQDEAHIFSTLQSGELPTLFEVLQSKQLKKSLKELVKRIKPTKLGLDSRSDTLTMFAFEHKAELCDSDTSSACADEKTEYEKVNFTKGFLEIREKKDEEEVKLIKKAQEITKAVVGQTLEEDLQGLTENQVAGKIESKAREMNASLDSFTPLVQNGERSAAWHNATTNAKIDWKKPVLIDVGAKYEFYCADYTTMYYEGNDTEVKDAIHAVKESQQKSQAVAEKEKNGKKAGETALQILREYGYANYTHVDVGLGLGHGVGLEVHDGWRSINSVEKLESGMCFTVEPGLYFPKQFGVRFEDIVFI